MKKEGIVILIIVIMGAIAYLLWKKKIILPPLGKLGDLNNDGKVDDADMEIITRYMQGEPISAISPLSEAEFWRRADLNKDGVINVLDMILIGQLYS